MSQSTKDARLLRRRKKSRKKKLLLFVLFLLLTVIFFPKEEQAPYSLTKIEEKSTIQEKSATPKTVASEWNLLLVNPQNKLPGGFSVELTKLKSGHSIDKRAYPDLQEMMDAARSQGLSPIICSSYRTMEKQQSLFTKQVNTYISRGYSKADAEKETAKWVAVPGTSEHQTGLAVDIVAQSYQLLDKKQEETPEQKWLFQNAHKYGFILRYPSDKSQITGISYEPWHYRYVGKEVATEIYEKGICLEEYITLHSSDL